MEEIENLIKAKIALARENMIFQLLGQFGNRIPEDVQEEMRKEASIEMGVRRKLRKRVHNTCSSEKITAS